MEEVGERGEGCIRVPVWLCACAFVCAAGWAVCRLAVISLSERDGVFARARACACLGARACGVCVFVSVCVCARAARETLVDLDDPALGAVRIRVGIHSGPIVANVVGPRSPRPALTDARNH